ncbi:MAG: FHA domain-containing protein [Acidobacteria bacterium]|nr:FHA domain-containing protein [Acidobacteriota bacterium]
MSQRHQLIIRDRHGFERAMPLIRPMVLGRQSTCDVVLPDSMISRQHIKIEMEGETWFVEDQGSSHGTFMHGKPITKARWEIGEPLRLADGAYILELAILDQASSAAHLAAILETAQLLAQEVELEDLLERSLDRLLMISGTDRGFLMLLESGELEIKVQRNLHRQLESDIHLSMSSIHSVFETGEPIWVLNATDDERLLGHQSIMRLELKTILCLPLTLQGKRIGVVYLDSKKPIGEPPDRATFEAIVALCAIAIERTRLSEENLRGQVLATVGQVASSIVHDFKNGLFVLRGHAEMLEQAGAPHDAKGQVKVVHHAHKLLENIERLSGLCVDVLDFAKVREPRRRQVEIGPYMESILEPLRHRAEGLGITVKTDGEACAASLDASRFTRVVENLIANAIEAVAAKEEAEGHKIAGEIDVVWTRVTGGLQLRVKDNGTGIPRKILRRIFEPFFTHGKRRGTGLGMATVKKIVEEHGGTLEVLSEPGRGTEVVLCLPDGTHGILSDTNPVPNLRNSASTSSPGSASGTGGHKGRDESTGSRPAQRQ